MSDAKMPATAAPNLAEILIQTRNGPHYPQVPDWYTDEQDAR